MNKLDTKKLTYSIQPKEKNTAERSKIDTLDVKQITCYLKPANLIKEDPDGNRGDVLHALGTLGSNYVMFGLNLGPKMNLGTALTCQVATWQEGVVGVPVHADGALNLLFENKNLVWI